MRPSQEILKFRDGTPLEKKRVAQILVFKIRPSQEILKIRDGTPLEMPSQEILKIRDGTPLEAEGILTYKKIPRNGSVLHFSSKLDVPSNVVQKKRVAQILVFKIRPSQEILKIRDGTPLEAEGILTYRKKIPRNRSVWHFSSKLDVPSNVVQKKRVAQILVFKIRPSQEILKIRDGTPLEKKRVARILVFKIRPSQEILKIRDGTPLEAEGILTYKKSPRNGSVLHFSSKLDVPSNVVQKKRVAQILVFKMRPSQEILKIRDGTPLEAEGILTYRKKALEIDRPSQEILKIRDGIPLEGEGILTYRKKILKFRDEPSQEILKIRDGIPLEGEGILTYRKSPQNGSVWSSQEILKIRDGTPLEAEGILTYKKSPRNGSVLHFSSKLDVPSNVVQKKRVAQILVFKIRPSQEILKIRDGTPLETEGILTYRKKALEIDRNVVQKKRVARILVFKMRPSQEILKFRDGTPSEAISRNSKNSPSQEILKIRDGIPLEGEGILTYRKSPQNGSVWHFSSKLDVPSNVVQSKRVAWILVLKIRSSQEILKIRDGTPLEAEGILTYKKSPRNGSVLHFSSKLDVPSNVVQKKRVAQILVFKIRPSQEILKIRDGTPLEAEGILTYRKKALEIDRFGTFLAKILKIRDGIPLEGEGILTYRKSGRNFDIQKSPRNGSVLHFSSKLDVPSNVVQKKRVAQILVFKIRPSQEILKIRDGTPLEAEGILTYRKKALEIDRPSQEILKFRDGTPLEMARILVFKIRPSQEILKIRDGIPLEGEGILTYRKSPQNGSVWHFSSKLDVPSNVVQSKRVAWILVLKIRSSQEILKIRDGTPLEAEGILTYKKSPRNGSVLHFSSKLDVPSNVVQKKRVAQILVFKMRPSQEILKIRDGTPLEAEGILTYRKKALEIDRFGTFLAS
ncbi:hypothetical protein OROHE_020062 [Orobanche hederae]